MKMTKRKPKKNYPKTFRLSLDPPFWKMSKRKQLFFFRDYFPKSVSQNTNGEVGTIQTVHSIEELIEAECLPKNWLAVVQLVAIQQVGKLLPANPLDWCRWTGGRKMSSIFRRVLLPNG